MNYRNLLHKIVVIPLVIAVSGLLGCGETIEIDRASFSGRVVDENGNPVAGLALVIQSLEVDDNTGGQMYGPTLKAETDDAGYFSITDIPPGEFQFMLAPEYWNDLPFMTEYQLLSVKIGTFTYHPRDLFPDFARNTFSITPGGQIENVEVRVRFRARVRAKVVFTDGTPLANKVVRIKIKTRDLHGDGSGSIGATLQTDVQGYFIQYVDRGRATSYTVSVEYKELSATSEKFVLKVGERREDLILKLSGPPQ